MKPSDMLHVPVALREAAQRDADIRTVCEFIANPAAIEAFQRILVRLAEAEREPWPAENPGDTGPDQFPSPLAREDFRRIFGVPGVPAPEAQPEPTKEEG